MQDNELSDVLEKNTKIDRDELTEVQRRLKEGGERRAPYRITRNRRAVVVERTGLRPRVIASSTRKSSRK